MPNMTMANMIPLKLLKRAFLPMVRVWDSKWRAYLDEIFPRMTIPGGGDTFTWALFSDPQMIAEMHSPHGRTRYTNLGMDAESWKTRLTKSGFVMGPNEFLAEFQPEANFGSGVKMQRLTQICIRSIERRVELELVNYAYGNQACIKQFSNQVVNGRHQKLDCTSSSNGMTGKAWNDLTNSDPWADMANIEDRQSTMGDNPINRGFIGNKTAKILKNHDKIVDRMKYVRDTSGGVLGAFFLGAIDNMQVNVVRAHTYKEHADNVGTYGSPGKGDYNPDTFNNRNKYWFMRESSYEFAIFSSTELGFTFRSKCNQFHQNPDEYYTYSYVPHEPHNQFTRFELKFAPGMADPGDCVIVRKVVPQTA